ncbi:MAG: hypothetical protein V2I27_04085 [Erythrobacter sp.]|nr:hypothetical protein [Erythrobacter sp.]
MSRTLLALLWAAIILASALMAVALKLPQPSVAILLSTLSFAAVASILRTRNSSCKRG